MDTIRSRSVQYTSLQLIEDRGSAEKQIDEVVCLIKVYNSAFVKFVFMGSVYTSVLENKVLPLLSVRYCLNRN